MPAGGEDSEGIEGADLHAEGLCTHRDLAADAAQPDDEQGFSGEVCRAETFAHRPSAFARGPVVSDRLLHHREQQEHRVLGDRGRVDVSDQRQRNPPGGERGQVDVVVSHPMAGHDLSDFAPAMASAESRVVRIRMASAPSAVARISVSSGDKCCSTSRPLRPSSSAMPFHAVCRPPRHAPCQ